MMSLSRFLVPGLAAAAFSLLTPLVHSATESGNNVKVAIAAPTTMKPHAAASVAAVSPPASDKRFTVAVCTEPKDSRSNSLLASIAQEKALSAALGTSARVVTLKSLREVARAAWAGELDAGWLPANLAVGLVNKGYVLLGSDGISTQMALVTTARIQSPNDLMQKALFVPQEDSLAAYVGIAMLSELNVRLTDLSAVYSNGTYEVAQLAVTKAVHDVTVLPENIAAQLVRENPGKVRILGVSPEVPVQMLVARSSTDEATRAKLVAWAVANLNENQALGVPSADVLRYVSRVAHYTPDDLPGVTRITARQAKDLMAKGTSVIDVRSAKEFGAKHIQGAHLVSYNELSSRVPGGNYSNDGFALGEISAKRVIFYCNGPECWKSYKAAKRGLDSGRFERVFWLRGGLPEWEREGLPIIQG